MTVHGVPFLTQALAGRYDRVDVEGERLSAPPMTVEDVRLRLHGVDLPLSALRSGAVSSLPVQRLEAQVLVPYDALTRRSGLGELTVVPEGDDAVRVEGRVRAFDQDVAITALSRLSIDDGRVVVTAESFTYDDEDIDGAAGEALRDRFDHRVDLGELPWELRPVGVRVREQGVQLRLTAEDTVLTPVPAAAPSS